MDINSTEFAKLVIEKSEQYRKNEYFTIPKTDEFEKICAQNYQNVSRETFLKIETYYEQILKWNKVINLISRSEEHDIWPRHIFDSLAIMQYLSQDDIIVDVGSGGGLPGIIIGILGNNTSLIEINSKKCAFLNQMKTLLSLPKTKVLNEDLQKITIGKVITALTRNDAKQLEITSQKNDSVGSYREIKITSRAFAKIIGILDMTKLLRDSQLEKNNPDFVEQSSQNVSRETFSIKYLLHKSKNQFAHEIEEARKTYDFDLLTYDNAFNNLSIFVELQNVKTKKF